MRNGYHSTQLNSNVIKMRILSLFVINWIVIILIASESFCQTFTKMTSGVIVAPGEYSYGCSWGDFNNDGYQDVFIANQGTNYLYQNNGDSTFTRINTGDIIYDGGQSFAACWGDYDNNGTLDLFVANNDHPNFLYSNDGTGTLTRITTGVIATDEGKSNGCSWIDYDNDGDLDLFVANSENGLGDNNNFLYENIGNGSFRKIIHGAIVTDEADSYAGNWADYDNDGYQDLFVANSGSNDFLYHNERDGTFRKIEIGDTDYSTSGSWGDYNNDGYQDLFIVKGNANTANSLYVNNGDGTFSKIVDGDIVTDSDYSNSASWGDYDNDGYIDLFVTNDYHMKNFLYKNNSDGSFTKILSGDVVNDASLSEGCSWIDFDNNGYLDLFVADRSPVLGSLFYMNNGNSNHWITLKCIGSISNRSGIGTQVKLKADINGNVIWQKREISAQSGGRAQNSMIIEFGLGNAMFIDSLIVKWSSGIEQILTNVSSNQLLEITESTDQPFVKANFSSDATEIMAFASLQFTNLSTALNTAINSWSWDFDSDGTIDSYEQHPQWAYSAKGMYSVTLIVSDGSVTDTLKRANYITVTQHAGFELVTTGDIVNDGMRSSGCNWVDSDNDGDLDLFLVNEYGQEKVLYQNNSDGTFSVVNTNLTESSYTRGSSWADYDNDNDLDVFVTNLGLSHSLYRNDGNHLFIKINDKELLNTIGRLSANSWADYDNDGDVDIFVTRENDQNNILFQSNGDGTFRRILHGIIVNDGGDSYGCCWGDYDKDGYPDLFVANYGGQNNFLYHNNGNGTFSKVINGDIANDGGYSTCGSWGDYNNDGFIDLFVINTSANNCFYQNNGDGTFNKITSGILVNDVEDSKGCCWADYDNDGDLDIFVSNDNQNNSLYENNGDGTFAKIISGDIVNNGGASYGCAWGDYDADGDLDLFVANGFHMLQNNYLFKNNGNDFSWINILCEGTISNTSAIGTKVRVKAVINGSPTWQIQEISAQTGFNSQNSLNVEFGLGNASLIDSMIIEWPSGIKQILADVAVNQYISITEETDQPIIYANNIADSTNILPNTEIQFTDLSKALNTTVSSWQWDFNNDGIIDSEEQHPTWAYSDTGKYGIRLVVSDGAVLDTLLRMDYIIVSNHLGFTKILEGDYVNEIGGLGFAWGDYDNDGDFDLFDGNYLYQNNGEGTLTKAFEENEIYQGHFEIMTGYTWGDYNNDGNLDIFISGNRLFKNNGNGIFERIYDEHINANNPAQTGSSWGDYNNDGYLDLFVCNDGAFSLLYKNNGDGTFVQIVNGDIVNVQLHSMCPLWTDHENDGDLDLMLINYTTQVHRLYLNNGNDNFSEILLAKTGSSTGSLGDYDNDGLMDCFLLGGRPNPAGYYPLLHNNGNGTFETIQIPISPSTAYGVSWGDYDNDGDLDLFVPGAPENVLFINLGNGTFSQANKNNKIIEYGTHSSSFFDYDDDGDLDLFYATSNSLKNLLFKNLGNSNKWIKIRPVGGVSNTSAIGAKVLVKATINDKSTWQKREISGADNTNTQNCLIAHFGLGDAAVIDSLIVEWPLGYNRQYRTIMCNVAPNQILNVYEDESDSIYDISPRIAGNKNTVDVIIRGWGFQQGAVVKLRKEGRQDIASLETVVYNQYKINASFDLTGRQLGEWNVVIVNPNHHELLLSNGFTIQEEYTDVWVDINSRAFRPGRFMRMYVRYGNRGNTDANFVPVWIGGIPLGSEISTGDNITNSPSFEDIDSLLHSIPTSIESINELLLPLLIGKIPAGGEGVLPIDIAIPPDATGEVEISGWITLSYDGTADAIDCLRDIIVEVCAKNGIKLLPGANCLMSIYEAYVKMLTNQGPQDASIWSWTKFASGIMLNCAIEFAPVAKWIKILKEVVSTIVTLDGVAENCWNAFNKLILVKVPVQIVGSTDPNEKSSPMGAGPNHFFPADNLLPYTIYFENVDSATAAAQDILVLDTLDTNLDWQSIQFTEVNFGDVTIPITEPGNVFAVTYHLNDTVDVVINGGLDQITGEVRWYLKGIDTRTGYFADFLQPNINPPEGEGFVSFTIKSLPDLLSGTQIRNRATIVFDVNPPLNTNEVLNTIDSERPSSRVTSINHQDSLEIEINWTGQDESSGSGIKSYSIYVSENGGAYSVWLRDTTATSGVFKAQELCRYDFYSEARDSVGHKEPMPVEPDTVLLPMAIYQFQNMGWYLNSLPVTSDNDSITRLFPDAIGAMGWDAQNQNYYHADKLIAGKGYWFAMQQPDTMAIFGNLVEPYTGHFQIGWHLIGGNKDIVDLSNPNDDPDGAVIGAFGWDAQSMSYYQTNTLFPKEGYWIAVAQECSLTVGGEILSGKLTKANINATEFYEKYGSQPPAPPTVSFDAAKNNSIPQTYELFQNYPNPFNAQTVIRYQLPEAGKVRLKIYNLLGQEIRTLIDEQKPAGYYKAIWDGRNNNGGMVTSGLYFYRIEAGEFRSIKKMLLLK